MGICCTKQKSNPIQKVNEDNAIVNAYKIKGIQFSEIEKCICKITRKTKTGTGFFCEIPEKNIKLLFTNNHVIDEIYLEQGNKIACMISEKEKEIYKEIDLEKDRYKLTDNHLDFTIIEILREDDIQNFLKINNEPYKIKEEIYSYQYAGGVELGFSFGKLLDKKENELNYDVGTKEGSSGSPVLLMKNSKVIGLHCKGLIGPYEKINSGIPIEIIINKISFMKCTYEVNNLNFVQIINDTDGIEVNKEIKSKIKILNNGKEEYLVLTKKFNKIGKNIVFFSVQQKLNDMSFIFNNCSTLQKVEFFSIETDNVTSMKEMFQSCYKLENVDLTNFNTVNVTNMSRMFNGCNKLKEIKGIDNFNTFKVTTMREMFKSCCELEYLDLTNFNIGNVTDKELIFSGCNKIKVKGIELFNKVPNNTKKEETIAINNKSFDEKSLKSISSYHSSIYERIIYPTFNTYYTKKKKEVEFDNYYKKRCKECDKTLSSYHRSSLCDSCDPYDNGGS